jgi:hypothetical protein
LRPKKPPSCATIRLIVRNVGGSLGGTWRVMKKKTACHCASSKKTAHGTSGISAQFGQMHDSPRHQQINAQAAFDPFGAAQLPLFDLAAALERAVIDFDLKAQAVPLHFFQRRFRSLDG